MSSLKSNYLSKTDGFLYETLRNYEIEAQKGTMIASNILITMRYAEQLINQNYSLQNILNKQIEVITNITEMVYEKTFELNNSEHFDISMYAISTLAVSHLVDAIHADHGHLTFVSPISLSENEVGEIMAMKRLKMRFGLPRNCTEQQWP